MRLCRPSIVLFLMCLAGTATGQQSASPKPSHDLYALGTDSQPQVGVPEGKVSEFLLKDSKTFPGFEHKWWLYVPAQNDAEKPIALMVFMDGEWYMKRDGDWRVPVVLDNLIARKELPVMAAVFVDPGITVGKNPDGSPMEYNRDNRSVEYDTVSAAYATFLMDEILPLVREHINITDNPEGRGIAACSSGGIGSFTVAWHRPDQFRKVLSFSGSFANIRGGQIYPNLIRQSGRKPIRVFQQDGTRDLVVTGWGNWLEANKVIAAALDEKGYDHQIILGEDTHCGKHGASIFPAAMRWAWRGYSR
jgi:enterochelin esterase-like enzyme